jgi:hypothetical protein
MHLSPLEFISVLFFLLCSHHVSGIELSILYALSFNLHIN